MNEYRNISGKFLRVTEGESDKIYTFVASTDDPDRHGTVINQDNWHLEAYRTNPIVGYQHNLYGDMCNPPNPDDVIGKANVYFEDRKLMADITFDQENDMATKIESKVDRGFLNTLSVGFLERGEGHMGDLDVGEDPTKYYFDQQELLEISVVNIPSNPKAAKKSFRTQTFDALKYIYRQLGGDFRFSDIEEMKVKEVIDLLDGKQEPKTRNVTAPVKVKYIVRKKSDLSSEVDINN
jgi:HK97 family phage prohead protease